MNNLGFWFHIKFQRMNEYFNLKFMHLLYCFLYVHPYLFIFNRFCQCHYFFLQVLFTSTFPTMPSHFQMQVLFTKTHTHRLAFYQKIAILEIYAIHSPHIDSYQSS
jgi:hypothetical protein